MSPVEGDDEIGTETICEYSHRRVYGAEREVTVALDEIRDERPITGLRRFHFDGGESSDEGGFETRTESFSREMDNLCQHERRHHEFEISLVKDCAAANVVAVCSIDRGV